MLEKFQVFHLQITARKIIKKNHDEPKVKSKMHKNEQFQNLIVPDYHKFGINHLPSDEPKVKSKMHENKQFPSGGSAVT